MIPPDQWIWYGTAGHYICAMRCRYHMLTEIGRYMVSTVGDRHDTPNGPIEQIGDGRTYETYVFVIGDRCDCGCQSPYPADAGNEVDARGANSAFEAHTNHMEFCRKYAEASH